ncbi:MAG: aldo/keto reductase [Pirellulales bacterium]|nr:aldo/keto reductase [Pirellulales bacterium]
MFVPQLEANLPRTATINRLGEVCRLGLATRGNTHLADEDVLAAVARGVQYLNWCGYADGMSAAVRQMSRDERHAIKLAVQLEARTADDARREIERLLSECGADYLDAVTYYYVEHVEEWHEILSAGGAAQALETLREQGVVRAIGLTSHQRSLATSFAASGRLDLLMLRYNAAHRGAERDVFPTCDEQRASVVAFTGLRWGALLESTPQDPHDFALPTAAECYRFVLAHPAVDVALMAPDTRDELEENLALLDNWQGLSAKRYAELLQHGNRVRAHAGAFP